MATPRQPSESEAEGEEMTEPGSGHGVEQHQTPDVQRQAEDYALSRNAAELLRPRRSLLKPIVGIIGFAFVAVLVAIGISRLHPVEQSKPRAPPQNESASPPQPDPLPQQASEPAAEPFKSFVLDAAQLYMATGRLPVVTTAGSNAKR